LLQHRLCGPPPLPSAASARQLSPWSPALHGLACLAEARLCVSSGGRKLVGLSRFELLTPRLSSVCSNQLSYRPKPTESSPCVKEPASPVLSKLDRTCARPVNTRSIFSSASTRLRADALRRGFGNSRKEVIQPQVLLQLPCYDFTPITDHTLGACLPCGLARRLLVQPAFVM
jgi:hypothetical protein